MQNYGWKKAAICAAVISITPAIGLAQTPAPTPAQSRSTVAAPGPAKPKAKAAGSAQIYNVTADVDVIAKSATPVDAVVCNLSNTLGRGGMKKPDVPARESFGVPAHSCAIVNGTYALELDTSDTPGPWTAIVTVGPAK